MNDIFNEENKIRIIIADDHELVLSGIKRVLSFSDKFEIVGSAGNGKEALKLVEFHRPDILLTDIFMPVMDGIEAVKAVKKTGLRVYCVMLTAFEDSDHINNAMSAGADGYLSKEIGAKHLIDVLVDVMMGERVFSKSVLNLMRGNYSAGEESRIKLTKREQEVLNLIGLGLKNVDIAERLHLSYRTVENHRYHITKKLGVNSSAELVRFAVLNK